MSDPTHVEPIETEAEAIHETDNSGTALATVGAVSETSQIDATIALAARVEELGKAMDKIRRFILSRALPGDWVRFKGPSGEGMLSLSGAGAERVAAALGVNYKGWTSTKEIGTDEHGPWLLWRYECIAYIGKLERQAMGRAGSRDKFFGYANDQWKPLQDVSEPNIRIAAMRSAQKEGVRQLFGLRAISETAAEALGLDLKVIRGYDFGTQGHKGKVANSAAPVSAAKPGELIDVDAAGIKPSPSPKFGSSTGKAWGTLTEKDLVWYFGKGEENLGGQYHAYGVANLMAIQPLLVGMGHAAKYNFVDKNEAPAEGKK